MKETRKWMKERKANINEEGKGRRKKNRLV